ncbi:heme exporter protein CcmD [Solirhodobacter olei]|uniref:heme exporter protein CcmD n=1 Tax=Solirhodobacter olei TaxID=2493082 RepID=UPI000FD6BAEE|nr:heme exporter protein CcmD [Solirhodobacter olei]
MWSDLQLGKYEITVLSAYAVALVLIVALIVATWARGRRVRRQLEEAEARLGRNRGEA